MKTGVSYFGNRIPEHYRRHDLPEIVASGCTYVLHTFSENDLQFYRGAVGEMVALTKQAGLEAYVDPWGLGGLFAGEAFSDFLPRNLDSWQVTAGGLSVPMACPRAPRLQELVRRWIDAAVDTGADVLFWDEPHLSIPEGAAFGGDEWTCRCALCQAAYEQRYGEPMPDRLTPTVAEFREDTVVGFLESVCRYGAERGAKNAACLLPFDDVAHGITHWEKVAAIRELDVLGVTPFWHLWDKDVTEFVGQWSRKVVALCEAHGLEPQVWLQAFLIGAGREGEIGRAAEVAYEAGARNVAAWGFRACEHMSSLRCERPDEAWRVLGQSFTALTARA